MNRDLAQHVARVAFRSSADLNDLIPLLREHCVQEEYEKYVKAIASASAEIGTEILARIFSSYPELEQDFEERIRRYGRLV